MSNIRLFLREKIVESGSIVLESEKIHYLKRVMRKKNGDKINIFNGKEQWEAKLNFTESFMVIPIVMTGFFSVTSFEINIFQYLDKLYILN